MWEGLIQHLVVRQEGGLTEVSVHARLSAGHGKLVERNIFDKIITYAR